MRRHAKQLQTKSKKHEVSLGTGRGQYIVTSATSGNEYTVTELAGGGFVCVCDWAKYHDTSREPCSHVISVMEHLEQAENRSLSVWETRADADRQHRPTDHIGFGLWTTSRIKA